MNWLDVVLLFIFVIAVVGGAKNGLIKSVISLVALIIGVVLAVRFYPELGSWLQRFISNQTAARAVAFVIIFLAVMVAGAIASALVGGIASSIGLGWLNKLGGAVFGLAMAAIVFGGILSLLVSSPASGWSANAIRDSFVATFLLDRLLPLMGALSPLFGDPRGWLDKTTY